jgi:DNA-directed RNA polymerase subunit beta
MSLDECRSSGQTFAMPLKVTVQLVTWDRGESDDKRVVRDIKEQEIYFADIPVMADLCQQNGRYRLGDRGTFLINGVDRVIVSQLHRSPGAVFSQSKKVKDLQGKPYYLARIIPMRGSWLDFEFDSNDLLYVRIDKKKKVLVTTLLQALGFAREDIIPYFYSFETVTTERDEFFQKLDKSLVGKRIEAGMLEEVDESQFLGKRITRGMLDRLKKAGVTRIVLSKNMLLSRTVGSDIIDPKTGEIIAEQGQLLTQEHLDRLQKMPQVEFKFVASGGYMLQPTMATTLMHDK